VSTVGRAQWFAELGDDGLHHAVDGRPELQFV
jgi:hypothetical protein